MLSFEERFDRYAGKNAHTELNPPFTNKNHVSAEPEKYNRVGR